MDMVVVHSRIMEHVLHGVCTSKLAKFYVTSFGNNLFSLTLCKGLKMIKMNCAENRCKECFGEYDICKAVSTQSIPSIKTKEDFTRPLILLYNSICKDSLIQNWFKLFQLTSFCSQTWLLLLVCQGKFFFLAI